MCGRPAPADPWDRTAAPRVADAGDFYALPSARVAVVLIDFQNDFCSPDVFAGGPVASAPQRYRGPPGQHLRRRRGRLRSARRLHPPRSSPRTSSPHANAAGNVPTASARPGPGAELFLDPVPGSTVITKHRYDCWQSTEFTGLLDAHDIDGLVIAGVELVCCVLYAVLGASERGYHYVIPADLVSGQDPGDDTDNRAIRGYLRHNRPGHLLPSGAPILDAWHT